MLVWAWVCVSRLSHAHSTQEDPHLDPKKAAVLTSHLPQADRQYQLSNHLALEVQGGEEVARALAQKYSLHYVSQVFKDPPIFHLHKPVNINHHHHHHRVRRATSDLVQHLANEQGVKWVNQERAIIRDKRHQIPGFHHTSSRGRPDVVGTHKIKQEAYRHIRLWQEEEELGLSSKFNSLRRRKTHSNSKKSHSNFRRGGNTSNVEESLLSSVSPPHTDKTDMAEQQIPSSQNFTTSNEEEVKNNEDSPEFNDPLYKVQWYLHNTGQLGHAGCDLNVTGAWRQGYTGQGVTLSILDDGFQTTNADLAANYNPAVSYSVVHDGQPENDPSPRLDPPKYSNSHGTYCAGVVAAVANNGVCGVGVAYNAKVGGVRIVDGTVTDVQEATALSRYVGEVAVFSASWGPKDDGVHVEGPGRLANLALLYGVMQGRGGRGTIYVWASGNGGIMSDNCNLDGYASSIYTLTVSALTDLGESTFYCEPCASTLAGVYVGGQHSLSEALAHNQFQTKVVVPELDGHCSSRFQGSSAAAPLVAGVVALVLQANPRLSWRDVQHLMVREAAPTPAALKEDGWQTNAQGKKFHLLQGFGAVDAGRMVEAALTWQNVGLQKVEKLMLFDGYSNFTNGWRNVSQELQVTSLMEGVEHVVATITLNHTKRKLLNIYIVSPSGTESQVLTHRSEDVSMSGFHGWGFMSVHFWGERPGGVWTVAIKCDSRLAGQLIQVELTVYGY